MNNDSDDRQTQTKVQLPFLELISSTARLRAKQAQKKAFSLLKVQRENCQQFRRNHKQLNFKPERSKNKNFGASFYLGGQGSCNKRKKN